MTDEELRRMEEEAYWKKHTPNPATTGPSVGMRGGVPPENDPHRNATDDVFNEMYRRASDDIMGLDPNPTMPGANEMPIDPSMIKNVANDAGINVEPKNQEKHNTDNLHLALAAMGTLPGVGIVADIIDAGLYLSEGELGMAGLSFFSAIPIVGDMVGAIKVGKTGGKALDITDDLIDAWKKGPDITNPLKGGVPRIGGPGGFTRDQMVDAGKKLDGMLGVNESSKLKNMITNVKVSAERGEVSVKAISDGLKVDMATATDLYYGAKLTIDPKMREIIKKYKNYKPAEMATLAKQYGVTPQVFAKIVQAASRGIRVMQNIGPDATNQIQAITQEEVMPAGGTGGAGGGGIGTGGGYNQ
jgi:hypothetical protein